VAGLSVSDMEARAGARQGCCVFSREITRLLGLTWERVDLSRGVIRLELTKSGKRREVPLNEDSYRALVSLEELIGNFLK
jgi:integrase